MNEPKLAGALADACRAHGNRIALDGEGGCVTYAQLLSTATAIADRLRRAGLAAGQPVMVRCSNQPSDYAAFLAAWLAGGVVVPVHRTSPAEVVDAIQAKAQCAASVDLPVTEPSQVRVTRLPVPDGEAGSRRALLEGAALVIFTSGSTGLPKGVVLSHEAFHGKLRQNQRVFGASPDTVTLLPLNNTFSYGIWMALMTLMQGGKVITQSRFEARPLLALLANKAVTFLAVVPTMIRATFGTLAKHELESARAALRKAGTLQSVVIGGEPLGAALSAQLREFISPAVLYDVYGLTETSTSDFILLPGDYAAHPSSIGKPASGVTFRIVSGELQLRTPYLMAGYLGDEALTQAAFSDGWFRTGDLAVRDAEGFVTIVGRLKELIVRGGNKITPLEVERALSKCPGVADAMVAGMPDPILGQRIHALLIPAPGERLEAASLRRELSRTLEKYKHPDEFYVGSALPTGRTGKMDRGQLQNLLASGTLQPLGR